METQTNNPQKLLAKYTLLVLISTVLINLLSAYIRHMESGLSCQPWPACFAVIGEFVKAEDSAEVAQKALAPVEFAKQTHRTIATALVIGVLLLVNQSRKPGAMKGINATLPYLLLAVILLLSVVGPASYLKTLPIIAVINLTGGLALMAICWWLYLQLNSPSRVTVPVGMKKLWLLAWLLLIAQIFLGAWLSANFAATACPALFSCQASGEYLQPGSQTFWYFRELALNEHGRVMFDSSSITIHLAHRLFALLTAATLLFSAIKTLRRSKPLALAIMGLVLLQCLLGTLSVIFSFPMILIMVHNLTAALLLLAIMAMYQSLTTKNV